MIFTGTVASIIASKASLATVFFRTETEQIDLDQNNTHFKLDQTVPQTITNDGMSGGSVQLMNGTYALETYGTVVLHDGILIAETNPYNNGNTFEVNGAGGFYSNNGDVFAQFNGSTGAGEFSHSAGYTAYLAGDDKAGSFYGASSQWVVLCSAGGYSIDSLGPSHFTDVSSIWNMLFFSSAAIEGTVASPYNITFSIGHDDHGASFNNSNYNTTATFTDSSGHAGSFSDGAGNSIDICDGTYTINVTVGSINISSSYDYLIDGSAINVSHWYNDVGYLTYYDTIGYAESAGYAGSADYATYWNNYAMPDTGTSGYLYNDGTGTLSWSALDLSAYVPYTGASSDVDLGSQALTTTGYITGELAKVTDDEPSTQQGDLWLDTDEDSNVVTIVDDTYDILLTDQTIVGNKTTAFTITLPDSAIGSKYIIKNINTGTVTLDGNGTDTIDGVTTQDIYQWECIQVQCYDTGKMDNFIEV